MKRPLKKMARALGFELCRYPRGDQLFREWLRSIETAGEVECVFDVGAHAGETIEIFRRDFPGAVFYAFEPSASAFERLCAKTRVDSRIQAFRLALGDRTGSARLYCATSDFNDSLLKPSADVEAHLPVAVRTVREETVEVSRLDHFCEARAIDRIDILKIDAQGFEMHVLKGAGAMLSPKSIRALLVEVLFVDLYDGQAWFGEIAELLRERGYRLFGLTGIAFDQRNGWKWADAMFLGADMDGGPTAGAEF